MDVTHQAKGVRGVRKICCPPNDHMLNPDTHRVLKPLKSIGNYQQNVFHCSILKTQNCGYFHTPQCFQAFTDFYINRKSVTK